MKKLSFIILCMLCGWGMYAQTTVLNTGYLQITLNRNALKAEGGVCLLDSVGDTVYIHSGAGYKNVAALWDVVVGNWGIPDGVGQMTTINDSIQTICMNLTSTGNYFQNPATYNADSGALPAGANVYNIGCVFRAPSGFIKNPNGTYGTNRNLKGAGPTISAVSNDCADIWILGVNSNSVGQMVSPPTVQDENGESVPAVVPTWVDAGTCSVLDGVQDISARLVDYIKATPNPFRDQVNLTFNMVPGVTQVQAQVYDVLGRMVVDLTPRIRGGYNSINWDGTDANGIDLPSGTYLLKVTNGNQTQTAKLIKI